MPRLSITLTESQAAALEAIAAVTGATKQSMIGLAITSWIRANGHLADDGKIAPEIASQELLDEDWHDEQEHEYVVSREGVDVGWYRGRLEHRQGSHYIIASAQRFSSGDTLHELGRTWEYAIQPEDSYRIVGED